MTGPVLKLLVVDGNTRETNAANVAAGGSVTSDHYAAVLTGLGAGLGQPVACTCIHPADADDPGLPLGTALNDFHGMAWTGSALNVYDRQPAVLRQIELARAAFAAGVPVFGSCWGLQVAVVAAGGEVRLNPQGREIGFARRIRRTEAGRAHPMLAGKPPVFDAICVHVDDIAVLPPGMTVLAGNDMSAVQAAEWRDAQGRCLFWGVQYHPEYDFREIGAVMRRYRDRLLADRLFENAAAFERVLADLAMLQADPNRPDLARLYGLDASVLDPQVRRAELRNWLDRVVALRAPGRVGKA